MEDSVKDNFYREVQSFFSSNAILVVGSGLSCAEGLPGMWGIATELIKEVPEEINEDSIEQWGKIKNDLLNIQGVIKDDANLEATLLKFPPTEDIELAIRKIITNIIIKKEQQVIQKAVTGEQTLKFSSFIKRFSIPETGLVVISTNYDRLVEIASEVEGIPVDNLFYGKNISELNEQKSNMSFCEGIERNGKMLRRVFTKKILIFKPHGCLNWYWSKGKPINSTFNLDIERLIITPGANKYRNGYNTPFDIHRAKANTAIDGASKFIIIGYGFNDDHLETHLRQRILNGIPTLILTRTLSDNTKSIIDGMENVIAISHFESAESSGTNIFYKNITYQLNGIDLWDIEKLTEAVF